MWNNGSEFPEEVLNTWEAFIVWIKLDRLKSNIMGIDLQFWYAQSCKLHKGQVENRARGAGYNESQLY